MSSAARAPLKSLLDDYLFTSHLPPGRCTCLVLGTPHHQELFAGEMMSLHFLSTEVGFVVSGHRGGAQAIAQLALGLGLPPASAVLKTHASNVRENFLFSMAALSGLAEDGSLGVITKDYAMLRADLTARHVLGRSCEARRPVHLSDVNQSNWLRSTAMCRKVQAELHKVTEYADKGHIASPTCLGVSEAEVQEFPELLGLLVGDA